MVALLSSTLGDKEDAALRAMFAARKSVFVDLLKWDLPVAEGKFEFDQFDDEHARYLILLGDGSEHLASLRLLPTDRPHILDTLFPDLCERPVPKDAFSFEITDLGTCAGAFSCEQPEHTRQPPGHTDARYTFSPKRFSRLGATCPVTQHGFTPGTTLFASCRSLKIEDEEVSPDSHARLPSFEQ